MSSRTTGGGGTHRVLPHDNLGTETRRENEKSLVKSLLDGNLIHTNDQGATEGESYVRKAKELHEDASVEDLASLALARQPKMQEEKYHGPKLSSVDIERSKGLVNDAVLLAQEAQKKKPVAKKTSASDRQKVDESFYFRYEKLHDAQEDVEQARKELGVNLREGNFLQIMDILKEGDDKKEIDDQKLGNKETFAKVQEVINGLYVRKPQTGEVEADSPAYLQMIKRKLHESRVQVDDLRKKIKDLSAGLKVASLECRSGQQLLQERNEELDRQRRMVSMLQLQIRNYKHRAVSSQLFAAGGSEADRMYKEFEDMKQENQDLVEINMVLSKEIEVLKMKAEFRGRRTGEDNTKGSKFLEAVETAQAMKKAEGRVSEMPTTQALKKLMVARRSWNARLIAAECNAMAMHDFDAGAKRDAKLLLQPTVPRRQGGREASEEHDDVQSRTSGASGLSGHYHGGSQHGGFGPGGTMSRQPSRGASRGRMAYNENDVRSERSSRSGTPDVNNPLVRSPRHSPAGSYIKGRGGGQQQDAHQVDSLALEGFQQQSKAWNALRRKVLGQFALSRADVIRREEAHVKKMRQRVTLLVSELSVANSEREMLGEKCSRFEIENQNLKEKLAHSQERVEKMMIVAGLAGSTENMSASMKSFNMDNMVQLGDAPSIWRTPAGDGAEENTDELISEELHRLRALKSSRKKDDRELTTAMEKQAEIEEQMKAVTDILNGKIKRLEEECGEKDSKINDLMRIVSQREQDGDTNNPLAKQSGSAAVHSVMDGPDVESVQVKNLVKETLKKDQELADRELENKQLKLKLDVAEDLLTEERATTNLGLSRKTAIRSVAVLRRLLRRARDRIEERRLEDQRQAALDAAEEGDERVTSAGATGYQTKVQFRAPKSEDPVLKAKRVQVEEDEDEEETLLRQVFNLAVNPQQKDIVSKQISALELGDAQYVGIGGPVARREKEWFRARRLWLRLLVIREQAWQEAVTEDYRRKMEARVTDTYEAFVKFEQSDTTESRPCMASNGMLRVLSMAASPISDKTGLKSLDEVEREYTALVELVKSRNAQLLSLQSERDEAVSEIDRLSGHGRAANKKIAVPPSALSIRHIIRKGETAAAIAAQYGLTNHQLINELFEHAPRHSMAPDPSLLWIPVRTEAGLETAVNSTEEEPILVIRHLVQDNETLGSIAKKFGVSLEALHPVATNAEIDLKKVGGIPCVDVFVPLTIAREYVAHYQPETPTQQIENTVFAALSTDDTIWAKVSMRALGRIFNTSEFDLALYNDVLEEGAVVHVPLLLNKATVAQMPSLIGDMKVHVWHTVRENDTKDSIADRYNVMPERLDGQKLTIRGQVQVPLTSLPALSSVIQDPALINAVEAMNDAEDTGADVEDVLNAATEKTGGANVPLLALDRSMAIKAQLKRLETRAGSIQFSNLSRKNTLQRKGTAASIGRLADGADGSMINSANHTPNPDTALPSPKNNGDATEQQNNASRAGSPSMVHMMEDDENIFRTLKTNQKLLSIARETHTLREEIQVPNFTVQNSVGTLWLARLRSQDSLRRAREEGAEVHCLLNLVDESIESLAKELSIAATLIFQANEELEMTSLSEKRFDYVRVPLINLKVQQNCLRRSGMVYAVVPTYGKSIEKVAAEYAVAPTDFSAYHVDLDPKTTPKVFFNRFPRALDAAEHRMSFIIPIENLDYAALSEDDKQRLLIALEHDTLNVVEFATASGVEGNVLGTSVTDVQAPSRFTLQVVCDTYEMAEACKKTLIEDGMYTTMESTQRFLQDRHLLGQYDSLKLLNNSHQMYQFTLKGHEATVVSAAVGEGTRTLTDIAMYCGVGVDSLFAFNNQLSLSMELANSADATPQSVLGVTEMLIPETKDKLHTVSATDTLQEVALKHGVSVVDLRRCNIHNLPLLPLVPSIRVPVLPHISRHSMIIKAQAEESFLALCTRFGASIDEVRADYVTISHGTELVMPPLPGYTTKHSRSRLPYVIPKIRQAERGETAESIAEETGLIPTEIIVANPSRVRICEGASVHIPVMMSETKILTTRPLSSEGDRDSSIGQVKREGLFIRHKISPGETLSKVAASFFQPVTALLSANNSLFHIPGAHLILIPLADEERDELLVAQVRNICTIIIPSPNDTINSISRKFNVPLDAMKDINSFMNDPKRIIIPLISPVAVSLARQQKLQLYASVQLQQGETLVALADRYNVFVKDLIVLGKALAELGVTSIDVPVAFDVAKRMQKEPVHKEDKILLASELRPGEQLKTFLGELGATQNEVRVHDTSSTYTEVALSTVKGLEKARDRETERLSTRSKLIDRTMNIAQALRQLAERNDATLRELEKVEAIREQNKELARNRQLGMNLESIGIQTEEAKMQQQGKLNQRNGMVQTKLSGQQYDYLEQTIAAHVQNLEDLTGERNDLKSSIAEVTKKNEMLNRRVVELGIQLTERTDRLNSFLNRSTSRTPGSPNLGLPTPTSGALALGGSQADGGSQLDPGDLANRSNTQKSVGGSSPAGSDVTDEGGAHPVTGNRSRPSTREAATLVLREAAGQTPVIPTNSTGTSTPAAMIIMDRVDSSKIVVKHQEVQVSLLLEATEPGGFNTRGMTSPTSPMASGTRGYKRTSTGRDTVSPLDGTRRPMLVTTETQTPHENPLGDTHVHSADHAGLPKAESAASIGSGSSGPAGAGKKSSSKGGKSSIGPTRSSSTKKAPTAPSMGKSLNSSTNPASSVRGRGGGASGEDPNQMSQEAIKLKRLQTEHKKLKASIKGTIPGFKSQAKRLAFDLDQLKTEFLSLFTGITDDLTKELTPLTNWNSADFAASQVQKAQRDEAHRNEQRVLDGVKLVSRNLVPHLSEAFSKARERRLESTLINPEIDALLNSVGAPAPGGPGAAAGGSGTPASGSGSMGAADGVSGGGVSLRSGSISHRASIGGGIVAAPGDSPAEVDDEEAWVAKQLGQYVRNQVQSVVHSVATGTPVGQGDDSTQTDQFQQLALAAALGSGSGVSSPIGSLGPIEIPGLPPGYTLRPPLDVDDKGTDPMTPTGGSLWAPAGVPFSTHQASQNRGVHTPDSLDGDRGGKRSILDQHGSLVMNRSPGLGDHISLPAIKQASKSQRGGVAERSPSLSALLGLGGAKSARSPATGHLHRGAASARSSNSTSPLPTIEGSGRGGGKHPTPPPSSTTAGGTNILPDPDAMEGSTMQQDTMNYLLMRGPAKSKHEEELRRRASLPKMTGTLPLGKVKEIAPGRSNAVDKEYDRIQGGVADLVANELAAADPSVDRNTQDEMKDEVVPVLAVIQQIAQGRGKMAQEQRAEVEDIRRVDRDLRKQAARAHFNALGGKLRVKTMLNRVRYLEGEMDEEHMLKVQGLWKKWLFRWAAVQKRLRDKRRENMQRLLSVFIQDVEAPSQGTKYGVPGSQKMKVPFGYTTTAAYGAPNQGIIVLRPFRPGSKLKPLNPVGKAATYTVPENERSSAHFSAVNFDQQD